MRPSTADLSTTLGLPSHADTSQTTLGDGREIAARVQGLKAVSSYGPLARSLDVYYADAVRDAAMDRLYARFLQPGQLAFDIGSHVGDRVGAFRRLGARAVALEPQPLCAAAIRAIYAGDVGVTVVEAACGRAAGSLRLHVNSANPTVTTASRDFVQAAAGAPGWEGQLWDAIIEVPVTTLDELVGRFGEPAFVKIDVEGFEADVLAGLTSAPPTLSFEFTTIQRDVASACLDRLSELGRYRFDFALGESHVLSLGRFVSAAEMKQSIADLPQLANSGDVYAVRGD